MIKISKYISVLLHPILLPTLATILFHLISPFHYELSKIYFIISLVFLLSYILPLLLLIFYKRIKIISNFNISKTRERKVPLLSFMFISFFLGSFIHAILDYNALSIFFFGSLIALAMAYLLLLLNFKTSLHLIGMSGFTAYLIILSLYFNTNLISFIALFIFLTGILATARLVLKSHSPMEILVGIIFGASGVFLSASIFLK